LRRDGASFVGEIARTARLVNGLHGQVPHLKDHVGVLKRCGTPQHLGDVWNGLQLDRVVVKKQRLQARVIFQGVRQCCCTLVLAAIVAEV